MGKLVVSTFVTLDGVMEAPGGEPSHPHTGWAGDFMGAEEVAFKEAEVREAGSLLLGRVTYESFAGAWPGYQGAFADRMNAMPKHVVSATLRDPAWANTTVLGGDLDAVAALKARETAPIFVMGSRTLAQALMERDLVDEYRLMVFPVVLGSGGRLFPETPRKTTLVHAGIRAFASGVVQHTLSRA